MALERASLREEMALQRPERQAGLGTQADWRGKGRNGDTGERDEEGHLGDSSMRLPWMRGRGPSVGPWAPVRGFGLHPEP